MKTTIKHLIVFFFFTTYISSALCHETPKAYTIFDTQGKKVSFQEMINTISLKQVVFFGEMHNCPICHWLEVETVKELYTIHNKGLVMGAEMFETDNQLILDEFLDGKISEKSFETEMRLWGNYSTDYVKLIEIAKEKTIPFIATNIPRRYASAVSNKGLEFLLTFSAKAKKNMPPLPIPYQSNREKATMFEKMSSMMGRQRKNGEFMNQAQAIKDATMAWRIAQSLNSSVSCFLHFNGSFHSDNKDGIIPFLYKYKKDISVATIRCCRQENLLQLEEENWGTADFIICIPEDMVHSY